MSSLTAAALRPLRIGMIGGGTVGGGVYDIIMGRLGGSKSEAAASPTTRQCVITKICVRDLAKSRSFHVDETKTTLVTDVNSILDDNSIDLGKFPFRREMDV